MKCPQCSHTLVMSERHGVEIDYCPECRGVWLDRGELDKILERSGGSSTPPREHRGPDDHHDNEYRKTEREYGGRKRRGGFLGELFDFGD